MSLFEDYLKNTKPKFSNEEIKPPHHKILIQSVILSGKDKQEIRQHMHNYIINTCGVDNIHTIEHKKIDPCLKLFKGCPLMINNNKQLEVNGCGNGLLCRLPAVKLKFGKNLMS